MADTRIKICGLTRPQDIAAANRCRPDYIGFVFAPGRRRTVTPGQAAALRAALDPAIPAVGVFVDQPPEYVAGLLGAGIIQIAQLHGSEDEGYLAALRQRTGQPVWKAFQLGGGGAPLAQIAQFPADCLLLDSGAGSGRPFDWRVLRGFGRPYFLAGGLSPGNIRQALAQCRPAGVDVSSGVETDGAKDAGKMALFVTLVRAGQSAGPCPGN